MYFFLYIIMVVCVLVSVAFITLLERSILGYIQLRKGPNIVGVMGLMQPFADALKLLSKELNYMYVYNMLIYFLSPLVSLVLMLCFWVVFMYWGGDMMVCYTMVYVMCISSMGVYVIMLGGWSSNSKYAMLGSYRGVAQTISYEVSFSFIVMSIFMFVSGYSLSNMVVFQEMLWMMFLWSFIFILWLVTVLAETNRTPYDFAEGESELVSGFNVEYGAGVFAVLFIAEYGNIIFMSYLTSMLFLGGEGFLFLKGMLIMIFILWVRGTLVRFRYDNLMMLAWSVILPNMIMFLLMVLFLKGLFNCIMISM
uniref:NADH-ubiquinone oxidoreductase chain 1 n=1 Tax=Microdiplogynium sp. XFX TaxID=2695875 RepID=A0A6B9WH52_9ACAR|nr:NADH dehydrogenase subunit 1 [Microdiplogynium sp. XFX]